MKGGKNRKPHGYTIVELMIVLAITGVMFLMAAVFISGKQGQVEFRQSVTDLNSKILAAINDVSNGFYPAGLSFSCKGNAPNIPLLNSAPSNPQGTNEGCIFLGKVIHFWVNTGNPATDNTRYEIFSVAGNDQQTSLAFTHPYPIDNPAYDATDPETLGNGSIFPDLTPNSAVWETPPMGSKRKDFGFAIFSNPLAVSPNSAVTPGTRTVNLYGFSSGAVMPDTSKATAAAAIQNITDADVLDHVTICVQNGTRQAYITVGGSGKLTSTITWGKCP